MKRIAVLTSSRADYSIYHPLLKALESNSSYELEVIAFGTHLSEVHGNTVDAIKKDGFKIGFSVPFLTVGDSPEAISKAKGDTMVAFSKIWEQSNYDLVFCLGDRYEMFAAVAAGLPFNIKFAHIHGGETTLGAIDNTYRHALTLMSQLHFCTTDIYKNKIIKVLDSNKNVFNVGSLSMDNMNEISFLSIHEFKAKFEIDLSKPTILCTFHPETVSFGKNEVYTDEMLAAFAELTNYQILITMPNADTMGNVIREKIEDFVPNHNHVIAKESLGLLGYLSAMKYCSFLLGNTSSGFGEAVYFPKYVVNLGDRQKGRILTPNIIGCTIEKKEILNAVNQIEQSEALSPEINIYGNGDAAKKIIEKLNNYFEC